jgi:hypothetical protein
VNRLKCPVSNEKGLIIFYAVGKTGFIPNMSLKWKCTKLWVIITMK